MSMERSSDWLLDALEDLDVARILAREGKYARSCFHAHEAAEKAVKALLIRLAGRYEVIHSVEELLRIAKERIDIPEELFGSASRLDAFYIPPRYPNVWPSGPSYVHFREEHAASAIESATLIVDLVKRRLGVEHQHRGAGSAR